MTNREPTAVDQLMLELINLARSNPQQEADRLLNGQLNEGVSPDSFITLTPKQPLAFNYQLIDSAYNHSQWMLDNNIFSHTGIDDTGSQQRMARAGYEFIAPWGSGENIAWKGTTGSIDFNQFAIDNYTNLFIDENYPNRGHRVTMMNNDFQEVGIASLEGIFNFNNRDYNAVMTTQNFAYTGKDGAFLTGVIYTDHIVNDNFYTIGEGISDILILAENIDTGDRFQTNNFSTGGYSLFLPSGTYDLSFIGNLDSDPEDDIVTSRITIDQYNIKLDLVTNDPQLSTGFLPSPTHPNPINNDTGNDQDLTPPNTDNNLDSLMNTSIYRLQNREQSGTYLYAGEQEVRDIQLNHPQFELEGLAFQVGDTANDNLTSIYRFQNSNIAGTYLFVGEEEKNNILQNHRNFILEGIAFHVLNPDSNMGNSIYRFQNSNVAGTYLFVGEEEKNNILLNHPNFTLEGIAFNVNY